MNYNVTTVSGTSATSEWNTITDESPLYLPEGDDTDLLTNDIEFNFPFAGTNYRSLYINQNGYLTFGSSFTALELASKRYTPQPIPNNDIPLPVIFGYMKDLYTTQGAQRLSVCYKAYIDKLIIEYPSSYVNSEYVTFQIILFSTGVIKLLYKSFLKTTANSDAKIGIQWSGTDTNAIDYNYSSLTNGTDYAITFTPTSTVTKTTPTINTTPTASAITYGQTLASSVLSGGAASVAGTFAFTAPSTAPNAGTYSASYTFTPNDTTNYNTATGTVNVTVNKAVATVTLGNLNATYNGTAKSATATTTPSGLTVNFTYNGSATAPTNAGTYTVVGTVNNSNYQGTNSGTLTITKATPTVSSLSATSVSSGSLLNGSTLSGITSTLGNLVFTTPNIVVSPAGTTSQEWTFTPTDTGNYNTITGYVDVIVTSLVTPPVVLGKLNPISNEELYYNRDRNFSGLNLPDEISYLSLNPSYGSRVEFSSRVFSYETADSYYNTIPISLNNLTASYKLKYELNESDSANLCNFLESKLGTIPFNFNLDNNIYKETLGYCDDYAVNHINNNHYEVAVGIYIDQAPTILNWNSSSFFKQNAARIPRLNSDIYDNISNTWSSYTGFFGDYNSYLDLWTLNNKSFKKYDIQYIESTGYELITGSFTWEQAKIDAENRGGRLAVLNTYEKQFSVPNHTGAMWIGGSDKEQEGTWKWLDESLFNDGYYNWSSLNPYVDINSNYSVRQGLDYDYKWNNVSNTINTSGEGTLTRYIPRGYILEYINKNKMNNFWYYAKDHDYNYVKNYDNSSFFVITGAFTWSGAKSNAEQKGGRLGVLNSAIKNNKIVTNLFLWIGANDTGVEGIWKWLDGTTFWTGAPYSGAYNNWSNGEPNNVGNEDYAIRSSDGKWNDLANNYGTYGYVLEMPEMPSIIDNTKITQDFFFEPDMGLQTDGKFQTKKVEFKNSFPLRLKTKNNSLPINLNYKFTDISDKQLKCMMHFLENKAGYRKFKHQIPSVYNRPKVFFSPQWTHTFKYYNAHDLEVTLIEDSLGIIPDNT